MMRLLSCFCVLSIALVTTSRAAIVVDSFDDIQLWAGTGPDRAAMVIDWTDGRNPLAWGFRFDASAGVSSEDMVRAVIEADRNLYAKAQIFNFGTPSLFVHGYGYDRDRDGFAISDGTEFPASGLALSSTYDSSVANDSEDSYIETPADFSANWSYWVGGTFEEDPEGSGNFNYTNGNPYDGSQWTAAPVGISDRLLTDGAWDGFTFDPDGFGPAAPSPGQPFAAVPEPSVPMICGPVMLMLASRRRGRAR